MPRKIKDRVVAADGKQTAARATPRAKKRSRPADREMAHPAATARVDQRATVRARADTASFLVPTDAIGGSREFAIHALNKTRLGVVSTSSPPGSDGHLQPWYTIRAQWGAYRVDARARRGIHGALGLCDAIDRLYGHREEEPGTSACQQGAASLYDLLYGNEPNDANCTFGVPTVEWDAAVERVFGPACAAARKRGNKSAARWLSFLRANLYSGAVITRTMLFLREYACIDGGVLHRLLDIAFPCLQGSTEGVHQILRQLRSPFATSLEPSSEEEGSDAGHEPDWGEEEEEEEEEDSADVGEEEEGSEGCARCSAQEDEDTDLSKEDGEGGDGEGERQDEVAAKGRYRGRQVPATGKRKPRVDYKKWAEPHWIIAAGPVALAPKTDESHRRAVNAPRLMPLQVLPFVMRSLQALYDVEPATARVVHEQNNPLLFASSVIAELRVLQARVTERRMYAGMAHADRGRAASLSTEQERVAFLRLPDIDMASAALLRALDSLQTRVLPRLAASYTPHVDYQYGYANTLRVLGARIAGAELAMDALFTKLTGTAPCEDGVAEEDAPPPPPSAKRAKREEDDAYRDTETAWKIEALTKRLEELEQALVIARQATHSLSPLAAAKNVGSDEAGACLR